MIWVVFTMMFLLAAAFVVLPLYRRAIQDSGGGEALGVYRQQLDELERELSLNLLSEKEAEAARLEIHRRMLGAAEESGAEQTGNIPQIFAVVAAILILGGASASYITRGQPGFVSLPVDRATATEQQFQLPPEMGKIEDRLAQLEATLAANPDNLEGWSMLARSYSVLGRVSDAANAYARAIALDPGNTEMRLTQAEALVDALGGLVSPAAILVFEKIQEMDPSHPAPRFYMGLAELQNNNVRGALEVWKSLEADSPPDAPWLPSLKSQIVRAEAELGISE